MTAIQACARIDASGGGFPMVSPVEGAQKIRFGVFEVDCCAHELRKEGSRIHLQEQPFRVLMLLLERAGETVTRDELRAKLWPSSVFVDFDHGLNNAIARLREALGDAAAAPHYIETLPRRGYRFIYPLAGPEVPVAEASDDASREPAVDPPQPTVTAVRERGKHPRVRKWQTFATVFTLTCIAVLLAQAWLGGRPVEPEPAAIPSLAVLPFANLSPDAANQYFADGLSEELATRLAGVPGLRVAAQTSALRFRNRNESVPAVAQALNVNHLLEGSVRFSGHRVRVTAQLIETAGGFHLWSETFDRDATDIFAIQEEIGLAVTDALRIKLVDGADRRLRKRLTSDPEAYRLYLVAKAQIEWVFGAPDWAVMKQSLEEAIRRDPEFAAAHALLSHYYFNRMTDFERDVRLGRAAAERAIALDPELSEALGARANFEAWTYRQSGDYDAYRRARADFRRALDLDPSNGQAAFHFARAMNWSDPDLALELYEKTLALDPVRYSAEGLAALQLSRKGRHDEARVRVRALYDGDPTRRFHNAINVAALDYYQGRLADAVVYFRETTPRGLWDLPLHLWALEMSLGDRNAASDALDLVAEDSATWPLAEAARLCMDGNFDAAFELLERRRDEYPTSRLLDVPAARLALIARRPDRAAAILKTRLPDLVAGDEPVDARNLLPALDLAAAWDRTGNDAAAAGLLERVGRFLDGPAAPRWPMFVYLRARAHALAGETALARAVLDQAYETGFRVTWAVDILPQSFLYIDPIRVDPAFEALQGDPDYALWLAKIDADNGGRLAQLRRQDGEGATSRTRVE
jgi:TolB-like protein/DNA-binding winged helix-turn-helix (wHTH) protein/Tfp pilus assembly protein PilF